MKVMIAMQEHLFDNDGVGVYTHEGDLHRFHVKLDSYFKTLFELQEMGYRVRFVRKED